MAQDVHQRHAFAAIMQVKAQRTYCRHILATVGLSCYEERSWLQIFVLAEELLQAIVEVGSYLRLICWDSLGP